MLEQISDLAQKIRLDFSEAIVTLECFSSGAAMLDVQLYDKLFVMAYSPTSGFGIDEVEEEEGFNIGYRFNTKKFSVAAAELNKLIESARIK